MHLTKFHCEKCPYVLAIVTTSVVIKSYYDNFSGSMENVKNAGIVHNTVNVLYGTVYLSIRGMVLICYRKYLFV